MKFFFSSLMMVLSLNLFAADVKMDSQMDDLIRGEMAAVKSYDQLLKDLKDGPEKTKLQAIKKDHEAAVSKLKTFATKEVQQDTKDAGVWGTFAKTYTSGAKLIGDDTALKALTQGEEHGVSEYKEALNDESIKPELKQMIRTQFLPKQEEHIKTIKTMM